MSMSNKLHMGENKMHLSGLTTAQVDQSRRDFGTNELPQRQPTPWWKFFLETFQDRINLILLGMLVVFTVLAVIGQGSVSEPIGIAAVLVAIGIINTRTGLKSEKSARELKERTSIRYCNVLRDGSIVHIQTTEVVVGDVVLLQSGDAIVADGYLAEGAVSVDNSVINGESKPCKKVPLTGTYDCNAAITGDTYVDASSLFSGTTILDGEGKMVVTRVGANTVNGQTILSVGEIEPPRTSLELQLDHLAGQISKFGYIGAMIIAVAIIGSEILKAGGVQNQMWLISHVLLALISALSIIVAAVPEGLPLIITLITAQNAGMMYRNGVLAKNPGKIPEAGNLQLLCTDKTGTLTYGKLIPTAVFDASGAKEPGASSRLIQEYSLDIAVNSSAMYDENGLIVGGNATERALLSQLAASMWRNLIEQNPPECKLPFNSSNKFSAAKIGNRVYYKGAPERLLDHAATYMTPAGEIMPIDRMVAKLAIQSYTSRAMRVIATAYYDGEMPEDGLPNGLTIIAFTAIRDDVRAEVPAAVTKMQNAGVQVMMVTGDVLDTANAIAEDAGIICSHNDLALSAQDFDAMSDEEATAKLSQIKVIARATPQTKLRIVQLAQAQGISVGMTGDGTNDAPALKAADVGFSMGSGTDVCKEAGDIVITDDNFVSITKAVLLGRTFMHNVLKFLKFQLPINLTLVILSIIFPLFIGFEAVAAVQILLINIVMDSLNSLSFGGEPAKDEYMDEQPIKKGTPLLSRETVQQITVSTIAMLFLFALTLLPPVRALFQTDEQYAAMRFALLVIAATVNGFNIRTDHCNLISGLSKNPNFYRIAIGIFVGMILVVQFGGNLLHCTPLGFTQWIVIFVFSLLMIPIDLIRKQIIKRKG